DHTARAGGRADRDVGRPGRGHSAVSRRGGHRHRGALARGASHVWGADGGFFRLARFPSERGVGRPGVDGPLAGQPAARGLRALQRRAHTRRHRAQRQRLDRGGTRRRGALPILFHVGAGDRRRPVHRCDLRRFSRHGAAHPRPRLVASRTGARDGGEGPEIQLSVEPTRFPAYWFTDASLAATLDRGRAIVSLWVAGRTSPALASEGAGGAFVQYFATPRVALELGGGSYLPDPYQGLPRAGFFTVGVRLHHAARAPRARSAPLVPAVRGDRLVVQFRMPGARSVAMAGDWNSWQEVALRPLGDDVRSEE